MKIWQIATKRKKLHLHVNNHHSADINLSFILLVELLLYDGGWRYLICHNERMVSFQVSNSHWGFHNPQIAMDAYTITRC